MSLGTPDEDHVFESSPISSVEFCGLRFVATKSSAAAPWVINRAIRGNGGHIHLLNAYSVVLAQKEGQYRESLKGGAINFPDGRPLQSLTRHWPIPLFQVRGPQLFEDVLEGGQQVGLKHYLLGGSPQVLEALERTIKHRYPRAVIAGSYSPPFRPMRAVEYRSQDAQIMASGAQIVWVGLGTPKQDVEAARLATVLSCTIVAVGAAFDFTAGAKTLAPRWLRVLGLEWLHRFASEPKRLWRRYLLGNPRFLWIYARTHIWRRS